MRRVQFMPRLLHPCYQCHHPYDDYRKLTNYRTEIHRHRSNHQEESNKVVDQSFPLIHHGKLHTTSASHTSSASFSFFTWFFSPACSSTISLNPGPSLFKPHFRLLPVQACRRPQSFLRKFQRMMHRWIMATGFQPKEGHANAVVLIVHAHPSLLTAV